LPSKNSKVHWDSNSQSESSLGSVRVHSLTFSYILGSMKCDSRASFLAYIFVSLCLGRKPKARVMTTPINITFICPQYTIVMCFHLRFEWRLHSHKINDASIWLMFGQGVCIFLLKHILEFLILGRNFLWTWFNIWWRKSTNKKCISSCGNFHESFCSNEQRLGAPKLFCTTKINSYF